MFPFVTNSITKKVLETPEQAYEAAEQFGMFTKLLSGFDINTLQITLPHFHDLALRHTQFLEALQKGNAARIMEAADSIDFLISHEDIVKQYEQLVASPAFKYRVTHHDTKISNVLFDTNDKGICVIDLDTVMPGHFISDVGDMMRTYLSPVHEEDSDFSKIEVRDGFYTAIVSGYSSFMNEELTDLEKSQFFFAGCYMIYMQALRFLTDYLNDDIYYGASYPKQNYIRAQNQIVLLQKLKEKEMVLKKIL
jgi:Ser/Thr protein kinase RdoA (MazF antagonist)